MNDDSTTPINPNAPTFHGPMFPEPRGWICPRCGASNAPGVTRCSCGPAAPCHPSHPGWPTYPYVGDPPPQPYWPQFPCAVYPQVTYCAGGAR